MQLAFALPLIAVAGIVQIYGWRGGDSRLKESGTSLATATGLGDMGRVTAFEPPHTGTNYLLREFCFVVGRRHSQKLRLVALVLGFGVPVLLIIAMMTLGGVHILAAFAVLSHLAGVFALRWLFFAEAEHVVGLYYGKRAA